MPYGRAEAFGVGWGLFMVERGGFGAGRGCGVNVLHSKPCTQQPAQTLKELGTQSSGQGDKKRGMQVTNSTEYRVQGAEGQCKRGGGAGRLH